jgi:5,10-methenyltetrahydrofolate synthetase
MRLPAERQALSVEARAAVGAALSGHLRELLRRRFGDMRDRLFSAYWPIKGEPDLRPLMADLHRAGARVALPLVEVKQAPLVFRRWTPETRMVRGDWNIPVPPPEAEVVTPDVALAQLVGWDRAGYRLGYGGGYFDRTLADLSPRPFTIGIGLQAAEFATIYPQPHDIRLDAIVTEDCRSCTCPSMPNRHRRERNGAETCGARRGRRSPPARVPARRYENPCPRPHSELRGGAPRRTGRNRDPVAQGPRPDHPPVHRGPRPTRADRRDN